MKDVKYFAQILYNRTIIITTLAVVSFLCIPSVINMINRRSHQRYIDNKVFKQYFPTQANCDIWTVYLSTEGHSLCNETAFITEFTHKFSNSIQQNFDSAYTNSYKGFQESNVTLAENYCGTRSTYFEVHICEKDKMTTGELLETADDKIYLQLQDALEQALATTSNLIDQSISSEIINPGATIYHSFEAIRKGLLSVIYYVLPLVFVFGVLLVKNVFLTIICCLNALMIFCISSFILMVAQLSMPQYYSEYIYFLVISFIILHQFLFLVKLGFEFNQAQKWHHYDMTNRLQNFQEKEKIRQQTQIMHRAQQGMSIPSIQGVDMSQEVSKMQLEYAELTFFDTFTNILMMESFVLIVNTVAFLSLLIFVKGQIGMMGVVGFFVSIIMFVINHFATTPFMVIFDRQLLDIDQVSWTTQLKQEECVHSILEHSLRRSNKQMDESGMSFREYVNKCLNERSSVLQNNLTSDESEEGRDFEVENPMDSKQNLATVLRLKGYLKQMKKIQNLMTRIQALKESKLMFFFIAMIAVAGLVGSMIISIKSQNFIDYSILVKKQPNDTQTPFISQFIGGQAYPTIMALQADEGLGSDSQYLKLKLFLMDVLDEAAHEFQGQPQLQIDPADVVCNFFFKEHTYMYSSITQLLDIYAQIQMGVDYPSNVVAEASTVYFLDQKQRYENSSVLCYFYQNVSLSGEFQRELSSFWKGTHAIAKDYGLNLYVYSLQDQIWHTSHSVQIRMWVYIIVALILLYLTTSLWQQSFVAGLRFPLLIMFVFFLAQSLTIIVTRLFNEFDNTFNPITGIVCFVISICFVSFGETLLFQHIYDDFFRPQALQMLINGSMSCIVILLPLLLTRVSIVMQTVIVTMSIALFYGDFIGHNTIPQLLGLQPYGRFEYLCKKEDEYMAMDSDSVQFEDS